MNRRIVAFLLTVLALAVTGLGLAQVASAAPAGVTARGAGTAPGLSFEFDVRRDGGHPRSASGDFRAEAIFPANALIAPRGPATCVEVRGDTVGFLYPLAEGSRPDLRGTAILITARDGGPGRPDAIGFVGPLPTAAPNCAPQVAFLPVTSGDIVVDRG